MSKPVTSEAKVSEAQLIAFLADIQATVIEMRRMACETTDAQKRDAYLQVSDAIEKRARELDQSSDQTTEALARSSLTA